MNILVINCGSSSLKFQLINSETEEVIAKGLYPEGGREADYRGSDAGSYCCNSDGTFSTDR